ITATTELVVPRSIPMILPIVAQSFLRRVKLVDPVPRSASALRGVLFARKPDECDPGVGEKLAVRLSAYRGKNLSLCGPKSTPGPGLCSTARDDPTSASITV